MDSLKVIYSVFSAVCLCWCPSLYTPIRYTSLRYHSSQASPIRKARDRLALHDPHATRLRVVDLVSFYFRRRRFRPACLDSSLPPYLPSCFPISVTLWRSWNSFLPYPRSLSLTRFVWTVLTAPSPIQNECDETLTHFFLLSHSFISHFSYSRFLIFS